MDLQTSSPDRPGNIKSSIKTSGKTFFILDKASSPSGAVKTSKPSLEKLYFNVSLISGSSSTM